jgi:hypothetical protein
MFYIKLLSTSQVKAKSFPPFLFVSIAQISKYKTTIHYKKLFAKKDPLINEQV